MVGECGAFPQALLVELGTCALEADAPRGACSAIERHRSAINYAILLSPKNGPGHVQSLNATVAVPGDLPTELQYTLDDSIGGARLQVERKAANELNDLVSDVTIAISRLPEPWQRMLELRKTHSMVQVSG
jgi:hypothetical protein